ncbi:DUF6455 family protein [Roseovarius salinarum]|uniref:DUF6455 family protein n=1 Tax=Roseovarius salinarum TaxID=1981892 RepID=UPI000C33567F|nr:DUF6455 family protein [Roseovarius salinarum]
MTAQLRYLGDPAMHFWLTRSMARATGLNLSEAMKDGRLTPEGYTEMVDRCRCCMHAQNCAQWLAVNGADADAAPPFCRLAETLETLR